MRALTVKPTDAGWTALPPCSNCEWVDPATCLTETHPAVGDVLAVVERCGVSDCLNGHEVYYGPYGEPESVGPCRNCHGTGWELTGFVRVVKVLPIEESWVGTRTDPKPSVCVNDRGFLLWPNLPADATPGGVALRVERCDGPEPEGPVTIVGDGPIVEIAP